MEFSQLITAIEPIFMGCIIFGGYGISKNIPAKFQAWKPLIILVASTLVAITFILLSSLDGIKIEGSYVNYLYTYIVSTALYAVIIKNFIKYIESKFGGSSENSQ